MFHPPSTWNESLRSSSENSRTKASREFAKINLDTHTGLFLTFYTLKLVLFTMVCPKSLSSSPSGFEWPSDWATDLQENNILLGIEDEAIFSHFEEDEQAHPSPRKVDGTRTIYQTRELETPKHQGRPVLCDFGEGRSGSLTFHEDIQPYLYRAPEVLLRMV